MEIASAFVSILPSAKGFGRNLDKQVSGEVGASGKRAGSAFGKTFAAAGGALIAVGVGSFLKDAVTQASDLQEAGTKLDAIFGDASKQVQDFAAGGAQKLGQTKLQVLDAAANFGTFGKAAGLGGADLAKFSTGFATLSTDLASFSNSTPEQAVDAIGAALRGEAEPIRAFGVLLDDATLRNEALKLGLISTTKEALTPQQKVLAAQAAIYKQTKDAQGDFQRTSGGLANQQRILAASFSDVKTQVGSALLPVVTKFVTFLNTKGIPILTSIGPAFASAREFLAPFATQLSGIFSGGGGGATFLDGLRSAASTVQTNFLPVLRTMATTFTTVVLPAILDLSRYLAAQLIPVFQQVWQVVKNQVLPIVASLARYFYGTVYPAVVNLARVVASNLRPVFEQLVDTFLTRVLPTAQKLLAKVREYGPAIQVIVGVLGRWIGTLIRLATTILGRVLPPAIRFSTFLGSRLVPIIADVIGFVLRTIAGLARLGSSFVNAINRASNFGRALVNLVSNGFDSVIDAVTDLPRRIGALAGRMLNAGQDLIGAFLRGLGASAGFAADFANQIYAAVRSAINSGISRLNGLLEFTIPVAGPLPDIPVNPPDIGGLYKGTDYWRGGLTWVGERGPELVNLPRGSGVLTNRESMALSRNSLEPAGGAAGAATATMPRSLVLRVGDRDFTAYVSEVADGRINSADDLASERRRAGAPSW